MTTIDPSSHGVRTPTTRVVKGARIMTAIGRALLALAFLSLLGAWIAAVRGGPVLWATEQHAFNDAIVLALLGIACLLDGIVHRLVA
jgi:hypothetical protein